MKNLLTTFILLVIFSTCYAEKHTVTVSNFSFSPQSLTINENDTVIFEFTSGTHTVTSENDSWTEFVSSSPATFTLFAPFKTSGTYEYYCRPHQSVMTGSITVNSVITSVALSKDFKINVYPNPCADNINVSVPENSEITAIKITDAFGKIISSVDISAKDVDYSFNLSNYQTGVYFCRIYKRNVVLENRKFYRK